MSDPSRSDDNEPTVLVVDDDPSVRRALTRVIRAWGWHAEVFAAASDFLQAVGRVRFGCAVLDVRMPGMTGPQLHERMVREGISLPVVFLTGHGDVPTGVQAIKKGAVDFLCKPVDGSVLRDALEGALAVDVETSRRSAERREIEDRIATLSAREREVMTFVIGGWLNKQIGADLGIAEKTVKVHRGRVMDKMGVHTVAELVRLCDTVKCEAKPLVRRGVAMCT